jgi:ADP-ribose pyrophosphatase YjhB (NUDIX family)
VFQESSVGGHVLLVMQVESAVKGFALDSTEGPTKHDRTLELLSRGPPMAHGTPTHSVSVAGIVVNDDDQVLVIQRRDDERWEPPGGILELGETFEQGVAREVFEETGVSVEVQGLSGVYKNMAKGIVGLVYRCRPLSGDPEPTAEAAEARWMNRQEVSRLLAPAYAVRVEDAFRGGSASRAHDGTVVISDDANGSLSSPLA